jgi:predicted DNA-binding helix-hairpin-helix protein
LDEAGLWADRLSANVELPTEGDLRKLAPEKRLGEITAAMGQMRERIDQAKAERQESAKAPKFAPAGQSTQIIVGATPSTDATILTTADRLYRDYRLVRIYYSAYSPIPSADPRLPAKAPPLVREHRLYQADWLMRHYGFQASELLTAAEPNLSLELDPKLSWALRRRDFFPVDVNRAPKEALLRVPGFGVRTVKRILKIRALRHLSLMDLARLRVSLEKVRPFVVTTDHRPTRLLDRVELPKRMARKAEQLSLFDAPVQARTGEL